MFEEINCYLKLNNFDQYRYWYVQIRFKIHEPQANHKADTLNTFTHYTIYICFMFVDEIGFAVSVLWATTCQYVLLFKLNSKTVLMIILYINK